MAPRRSARVVEKLHGEQACKGERDRAGDACRSPIGAHAEDRRGAGFAEETRIAGATDRA
jgi:hypothetical protein